MSRIYPYISRLVFLLALFASAARADEYDTLRLKWKDIIVGSGYDINDVDVAADMRSIASSADSNWLSMDKSPTRTFLWSDLTSTTNSAEITNAYGRLRAMALAYATPGCTLQGNPSLLADTVNALEWMDTNRYNKTSPQYDNWWDWEIGAPQHLTDIGVLLYDNLTADQLDKYMDAVTHQTPTPDMTGANKIWKARIVGVRGVLVKDNVKLALCRDAFSAVFPYVTTGDGFYTDGSFIQHNDTPYTAGYAGSLLSTLTPVMSWLSGSSWAVSDPAQANLYRWVFDSFEPIIYNGLAWDLVRGRDPGRTASPMSIGDQIMDSILQIAQFAPPADGLRMKRMLKEWASKNTTRNFVTSRGPPTIALAKSLMNDGAIAPRGELLAHYTFGQMDRVVRLGPGYGFGLSMHSTRIANFESINGDNLRGWFTGDGQTTLYNGDLNAFTDAYTFTVDAYRLPGVTADVTHIKLPANNGGKEAQGQNSRSPYSLVGGATLGRFGAACMQFKGVGVTLTGYKSWFMFDDEIVCLGSGITSTDSRPIETTVEQRKLNSTGNNGFTVNGTAKSSAIGWAETMNNVNWAHLAGHVANSDIGYYFPTAPTIRGLREARTGKNSEICTTASATPATRNYLRMTFEHGSNPANAAYQYVLLPGRNTTRTSQYAAAPQVTILANDTNIQAVAETTLGITAANFLSDTAQTVGGITANKKACVLVRGDGTFIDVSVSDPTQLNPTSINLQIALDAGTLISADDGVTVTQSSPSISLSVKVAGAFGKTFKARFSKVAPQIVNLSPEADSYVHDAAASTNSNFGQATSLVVKTNTAGYNRESFLRFNVPPATDGILVGATLKLMCIGAQSPGVHGVAKVEDNTWTETGITWTNKPTAGAILNTWSPAVAAACTADVTSAVPASGPVSFEVSGTTQTSDGLVTYGSKENTTPVNRPVLSLFYTHTPPQVSITAPADGSFIARAGNVTLTAAALATDGAVTSVSFYKGATLLGTALTPPYTITPSLAGGPHYIKAVASDANGRTSTSLPIRIDIAYPAATATRSTPQNTPIVLDLRTLVSGAEAPLSSLYLKVGTATNGTVMMLPDRRTARFTPATGYSGPASFAYTVIDTTRDERTLLNYTFQNSDFTDNSGQGRDGTLRLLGTGAATFADDSPLADYTKSIALTENDSAGAARIHYSIPTSDPDLQKADWTIAGWFNRKTNTNLDSIVQLGQSGGYASHAMTLLFSSSSNTLTLFNYNGSTQDVKIETSVRMGEWHHFAIVRNGTTLSLYINGIMIGSDTNFTFSFSNSSGIKFGGVMDKFVEVMDKYDGLDRWLNGSLADLAVFNTALSGAEVTRLTNTPVQWFGGQSTSATISISVGSPIEAWRLQNFGTTSATGDFAGTADKDNDGLSNLIEYACATDPNTPSAAPYAITSNGANLDFTYTKNKSATDLIYLVEWSDFLLPNSWSSVGISSVMLSDNGATQQIKATVPTGTSGRMFVRLRVTR